MKPIVIIIIIIILFIIGVLLFNRKSTDFVKAPTDFVLLHSKTETTDFLPVVEIDWHAKTELKYKDKEWSSYPNEYSEQAEKLCNDVYDKWNDEITHAEFLNQLTKEQRMYFALITFEAQVNNGGVYQFLFNYPDLSIITLDAMKSAKMEKLSSDYEAVLNEFFGKFETIKELNEKFQDENTTWDKRWNSFIDGYNELPSSATIENYFFNDKFVKEFGNKMVLFVKDNQKGLFKTK